MMTNITIFHNVTSIGKVFSTINSTLGKTPIITCFYLDGSSHYPSSMCSYQSTLVMDFHIQKGKYQDIFNL